jgi:hypothetical protein
MHTMANVGVLQTRVGPGKNIFSRHYVMYWPKIASLVVNWMPLSMIKILFRSGNKQVPTRIYTTIYAHCPSLMTKWVPNIFNKNPYLTPRRGHFSKIKILFAHTAKVWLSGEYLVVMVCLLVKNSGVGIQFVRRPIHPETEGEIMF